MKQVYQQLNKYRGNGKFLIKWNLNIFNMINPRIINIILIILIIGVSLKGETVGE